MWIAAHGGKRALRQQRRLLTLDQSDQIVAYGRNRFDQVEDLAGALDAAGLAQCQQVIDQVPKAPARLDQMIDVLKAVRTELTGKILGQDIAVRLQGTQGLLEIVRDDVREIFQFTVDKTEPRVGAFQLIAAGTQLVRQAVRAQ